MLKRGDNIIAIKISIYMSYTHAVVVYSTCEKFNPISPKKNEEPAAHEIRHEE